MADVQRHQMRFCCPTCGREEEILVDRNPRCRFCGVEMLRACDYKGLWMSPYMAIVRMQTISEKYGVERARTDKLFKKEREARTTALLALALTKLNGEQWWIEIETIENTPDNSLKRLDQSSGHNVIQTRCIEVVDWEENVEDIMEVIRKKCERAYPGHYLLLVNARYAGKLIDFDRIIERMKSIHSPFLEVWVAAFVGDNDVKVARVEPSRPFIDLNVRAELETASKQPGFMKPRQRGSGTEVRDLGLTFLPIP